MYPQYHHHHQPYTHATAHVQAHPHGHLYIGSQGHAYGHTIGGASPSVGGGGVGGVSSASANIHFHGGTIDPLVAAWIWAEIHLSPFVFLSSSALQHMLDLQRPALVDLAVSASTPGAYSGGPAFSLNIPAQSQQAYPGIASLSSSPSPCTLSSLSSLSSSWTSSTASSSSISSRSPVLSVGSSSNSTAAAAAARRSTPASFFPASFAAPDHSSPHCSCHPIDAHCLHAAAGQHVNNASLQQDAPRIDRSPTWRARAALYREFAQLYPDHFKSLVAPPPPPPSATTNPYAYGGSAYHDLDSYFAPRAYGSTTSLSSSPPRFHSSVTASSTSPYLGHHHDSYSYDPDAPDPLLTMVAARMIRSPVTALFPSDGWSPAYLSPYWARSLRSCSGLVTSVQKIALAKAVFDHEGDVCGVKLTVKGLVPDGAPGATELVATATVTTTSAAAAAARVAAATTRPAGGAGSAKSTPKKPAHAASPKHNAKSPSSPKPSPDTLPALQASALTPILTLCRILVGPGRYPVHTITDCFAFVLGVSLSSAWLALAPLPTFHPPATRPGQPKLSTLDLLVAKLGGSGGGGPLVIGEWQCEISAASMGHSAFLKSCGASGSGAGAGGAAASPSPVSVRVLPGGAARLRGKWNARPVPPHTGEFLFDDIPGIQEYMRWVADLVAEDPADLVECTRASLPVNTLADHPDKDALAVVEAEIRAMAVPPQCIAPADPPAPAAHVIGLDCFSIWRRNAAWVPVRMPGSADGGSGSGSAQAQGQERAAEMVRDISPYKKKKRADSAVSMGGVGGAHEWDVSAMRQALLPQAADEAIADEAADASTGRKDPTAAATRRLPKLGTKDAGTGLPAAKKPPTVLPV